jgi:hypothetical protein
MKKDMALLSLAVKGEILVHAAIHMAEHGAMGTPSAGKAAVITCSKAALAKSRVESKTGKAQLTSPRSSGVRCNRG